MAFTEMKAIPVDQNPLGLVALKVAPRNNQDGVQATNYEKVPVWLVSCYGSDPIRNSLVTIEVKVPAEAAPQVEGRPVQFRNMVARPWVSRQSATSDFEGDGISFSAEAVSVRAQSVQAASGAAK